MIQGVTDVRLESGASCNALMLSLLAESGQAERLDECIAKDDLRSYLHHTWMSEEFDPYRSREAFQSALRRRNIQEYDDCCPP